MNARRSAGVTAPLVTAAAASYATNVAFGTAVATGVVDNSRIGWVHHAMFIATSTLTVAAITASAIERKPAGLALLGAVGPLLALPRIGGTLPKHATVAALAAPSFVTALILAWRRN
jgi:hypothetical protein